MRILIVENNYKINKILSDGLKEFSYQSDIVETIKDAQYYLDIRSYHLVLIDWGLVNTSKVDIVDIKLNFPKTSIIVLSDKDNDESEIEALYSGADDYIRKPFNFNVVIARINARLRSSVSDIITIADLVIYTKEGKLTYKDRVINLEEKAFEVLSYFAQHRDQILTKEQLLYAMWEEPELVTPSVIDVVINRIRERVDKPCDIITIETIHRRGYRFCFPKEGN